MVEGILKKLLLSQIGMHLDLEHSGLNLSIIHHLTEHGALHVADANILDEAITNELFHGLPGLLEGHSGVDLHLGLSGARVMDPLRRVASSDGNILHRDGEVDEVEVKVLNS